MNKFSRSLHSKGKTKKNKVMKEHNNNNLKLLCM